MNFNMHEDEDNAVLNNMESRVVSVLSSKGDQNYEVTVTSGGIGIKCTCPGYTYRGNCKHLNMVSDILYAY